MKKQAATLAVLAAILAGIFAYPRLKAWRNNPTRIAEAAAAKVTAAAADSRTRMRDAARRDAELARAIAGTGGDAVTRELRQAALARTEARRFGLAAGMDEPLTGPLFSAAPPAAARPALVFFAPLYALADNKPSKATLALESMLRFHLRTAVAGTAGLNLVPHGHMRAPYARDGGDGDEHRGRDGARYLADARALGADVFVYGRADLDRDGAVTVQLGFSAPADGRAGQFARTAAKARLGEVVADAVTAVARFAGLSDAETARLGFAANPPDGPALDFALSTATADRDLDSTPALDLARAASPASPWTFERAIGRATVGGSQIAAANQCLGLFPGDPRMVLAKAEALGRAGRHEQAAGFAAGFCRLQPDSLLAASHLRLAAAPLADAADDSEWSLLAAHYRGAALHMEPLSRAYPEDWALRWDMSVCRGNAARRVYRLMAADAATSGIDLSDPMKVNLSALGAPYVKWPEETVAGLRTALARRPDCVDLMVAMLYWHDRLTDRQGDDEPAKALQWQTPLLAKIAEIEPRNVEGELIVARQQGVEGEGAVRRFERLQAAAERAAHAPKVMEWIVPQMVEILRARMDWKSGGLRNRENAKRLAGLAEADFFVQALRESMQAGGGAYRGWGDMLNMVEKSSPERTGIYSFWGPALQRTGNAAKAKLKAGDPKEAIRLGRNVVSVMNEDGSAWTREIIVEALWGLQRWTEAMREAAEASYMFPDRHSFHASYAQLALAAGENYEQGLEHARLAAEVEPDDRKNRKTLQDLARKLGRKP